MVFHALMSADAAPTHDDLIKKLLHQPRLLREFCRAFLPGITDFVDLSHIQYLDKEHPRTGKRPRRLGDILVKTLWRGQEAGLLVHIESQSTPQPACIERAGEYALRDSIRYRLPVMPVVLLTYPKPDLPQANHLRWEFGKLGKIHITCPILHFRRMDPAPHLRSRNVAALALTALMKLTPDQQVHAIVQTMAEALRQHLPPDDLEAATEFVNYYLPLKNEQILQVEKTVYNLSLNDPALTAMPKLINPFVELGKIKGRQEGLQQGRREWGQALALRQIGSKFPSVAKRAVTLVQKLDDEALLAFGEAILFMQTPADCVAWLKKATE